MLLALALTISAILTFLKFDLEKVGQVHQVKFLQWCHLMGNIKIYKSCMMDFWTSSLRFRDISTWIIWPWKSRSMPCSKIVTMGPFYDKYQSLYKGIFLDFVFHWDTTCVHERNTQTITHSQAWDKLLVITELLQICLKVLHITFNLPLTTINWLI